MGHINFPPPKPTHNIIFEEYVDGNESPRVISVAEDPVDCKLNSINLQPEYDQLVNLELSIP